MQQPRKETKSYSH